LKRQQGAKTTPSDFSIPTKLKNIANTALLVNYSRVSLFPATEETKYMKTHLKISPTDETLGGADIFQYHKKIHSGSRMSH
jgi:hypothetical protein